jgi:hypothetical protein
MIGCSGLQSDQSVGPMNIGRLSIEILGGGECNVIEKISLAKKL